MSNSFYFSSVAEEAGSILERLGPIRFLEGVARAGASCLKELRKVIGNRAFTVSVIFISSGTMGIYAAK